MGTERKRRRGRLEVRCLFVFNVKFNARGLKQCVLNNLLPYYDPMECVVTSPKPVSNTCGLFRMLWTSHEPRIGDVIIALRVEIVILYVDPCESWHQNEIL